MEVVAQVVAILKPYLDQGLELLDTLRAQALALPQWIQLGFLVGVLVRHFCPRHFATFLFYTNAIPRINLSSPPHLERAHEERLNVEPSKRTSFDSLASHSHSLYFLLIKHRERERETERDSPLVVLLILFCFFAVFWTNNEGTTNTMFVMAECLALGGMICWETMCSGMYYGMWAILWHVMCRC